MKVFSFKTEDDFLERFDGEIHAIYDTNGNYLCDLLTDDWIKLKQEGFIVSFEDVWYDLRLSSDVFRYKVLSEAVLIRPMYKK